ncbi:hypothetical protein FGF94_24130, partial [Salmonella sp. zj-f54]|nr:hypothetical protein [Salmonella sp. zj-f54]
NYWLGFWVDSCKRFFYCGCCLFLDNFFFLCLFWFLFFNFCNFFFFFFFFCFYPPCVSGWWCLLLGCFIIFFVSLHSPP